ncbi:hypothetical protein M9H77_32363 [Catharanthus roseus]|uniref:Uncharacterized protein n=1 Tax=Catharanthus roseus TaxID=4058 RepID=A0ACC0A3M7_CATRO|nr:hypothetical protein M9H77_32363 [Catharanthus roseus]
MNISTSECSSGCESGWTMYLDQFSSSSMDQCNRRNNLPSIVDNNNNHFDVFKDEEEDDGEEDEDLSMLSDASSGPPPLHFCQKEEQEDKEEEEKRNKNNRKKVKEQRKIMQQSLHLDDTASSSPVFNFSKNAVLENDKSFKDHDSGYSATHYKVSFSFPSSISFLFSLIKLIHS